MITKLLNKFKECGDDKKLVVNTCGWIESMGKDLLYFIMKEANCDGVVSMHKANQTNAFHQELES